MTTASDEVIELRVDDTQLFHTLDPFPFRERDLDREAEEYIVGWARELAADQPIKIVIRRSAVHSREMNKVATGIDDRGGEFQSFFRRRLLHGIDAGFFQPEFLRHSQASSELWWSQSSFVRTCSPISFDSRLTTWAAALNHASV